MEPMKSYNLDTSLSPTPKEVTQFFKTGFKSVESRSMSIQEELNKLPGFEKFKLSTDYHHHESVLGHIFSRIMFYYNPKLYEWIQKDINPSTQTYCHDTDPDIYVVADAIQEKNTQMMLLFGLPWIDDRSCPKFKFIQTNVGLWDSKESDLLSVYPRTGETGYYNLYDYNDSTAITMKSVCNKNSYIRLNPLKNASGSNGILNEEPSFTHYKHLNLITNDDSSNSEMKEHYQNIRIVSIL